MNTYVVGHKNPDTDSVVSAVALAELEGFIATRSGELNKETQYVLERFGIELPEIITSEEKKVVLVDNNGNPEELATGVKEEEVISVYDHHKLGGLTTNTPITVWIDPVGSTATIISELYDLRKQVPIKKVASLLLAGIISDTLNFASPTTCDRDHYAAESLKKIAEIDPDELAEGMFAAKSDISDIPTAELLGKDYKVFDFSGKKVGIGVWETVKPELILERKKEILAELDSKKESEGLFAIFFAAVDILNNNSKMFLVSKTEEEIVKKAYNMEPLEQIAKLDGVVSRKKQMTPQIEKAIGA